MSAVPETQVLRGGLGADAPPARRRVPKPPRKDPQAVIDDLVCLHGGNVTEWADWPALLARQGLVESDVSARMLESARERARTRTDHPPRPRESDVAVCGAVYGDTYPGSPCAGREALRDWAEGVRDMAGRRGKALPAGALMTLAHSRDKSLLGELYAEELRAERDRAQARAPARNGDAPRRRGARPADSPPAGLDRFRCRANSSGGRVNAELTTTPRSSAELAAASGVPEARVKDHLSWCLRHKDHPLGAVLICTGDGRWALPEGA